MQLEAAIKNIINKEFKTHQNKARKNSLVDSKNQESNAISNGQSSRKQQNPRKREPTNNSSPSNNRKHQGMAKPRTNNMKNNQPNPQTNIKNNVSIGKPHNIPRDNQNNTKMRNTSHNQHGKTWRMLKQRKRSQEGSERKGNKKLRRMNWNEPIDSTNKQKSTLHKKFHPSKHSYIKKWLHSQHFNPYLAKCTEHYPA